MSARAPQGSRMDEAHPLARELRQLRLDRGMTLAEVAQSAGMSTGAISNFECGHRTPSLDTLGRWAHVLGASVVLQQHG